MELDADVLLFEGITGNEMYQQAVQEFTLRSILRNMVP
jgi:hypothetical protein